MTDNKKQIEKSWEKILGDKISDLRSVLNKCVEYQTVILRSHLFIEQLLELIINQELINSSFVLEKSNLSFIQKLYLVRGLDQIEKELYDQIFYLNSIRNKYAHNINYEINDYDDISKLGRTLGRKKYKDHEKISESKIHLLVLIVHDICKNAILIYSLNESVYRQVDKELNKNE